MAITEKQLAGNHRRTLRAMRKRLLEMSGQWDGLDQCNISALSDLADLAEKCEQVAAELVPDPIDED